MNKQFCSLSSLAYILLLLGSANAQVGHGNRPVPSVDAQDLTAVRPVEGGWGVQRDATISGRVFDVAGMVTFRTRSHNQLVFANRGDYTTFEAWVGWQGYNERRQGSVQFIVVGDGEELKRSPKIGDHDVPFHVMVPIKGKRSIMLVTEGDTEVRGEHHACWAMPKFTKVPSAPSDSSSVPGEQPVDGGGKVLRLEPEKIEELAGKLKSAIQEDSKLSKTKPKLAIAKFMLIPSSEPLAPSNADNVREDLSTALINTKAFSIVERGQLDKALNELKLNQKDTFDSAKAQQLGKLIGARLVLIGSISDREGKHTVINARLVDTQTGEILSAARVEIGQ